MVASAQRLVKPNFRHSGPAQVFHFRTATAAKLEENSAEKENKPRARTFTFAARRGMLTGNSARMIFEGWRGEDRGGAKLP